MRVVTLDCETFPVQAGVLAPQLVCVQTAEAGSDVEITIAIEPRLPARLADLLTADVIVGHNISYDLAVIGNEFPELWENIWRALDEGRVFDTFFAASLLDIARGDYRPGSYSLAKLSERYCEIVLDKGADSWQLRYGELYGKPVAQWPAEAVKYATEDVKATYNLWRILTEQGKREIPTLATQIRGHWALHLCSCRGMRTDPVAVAKLEAEITQHKQAAFAKLCEVGFLRPNGTRDDKAVRAHAEKVGVTKRTAGGKVSTGVDALSEIDDPDLKLLVDYLSWEKLESTYLPVVQRGTREPIQARYGLVESGRTGCSNPNLQNLPRKGGVRQCFVPRPGYVYVAADYSIVELVCLSQVLLKLVGPQSAMARALISGQDLHLVTGAQILGWDYDKILAQYKAGDPAAKEARQLAKALNFGIPGGLGAATLAQYLGNYGFKLIEEDAKRLKTRWLQLYPEMNVYFQRISAEGRFAGCVKHPITGFLRGGLDYCSLANHYFQHLASYGAKLALYAVQRACWLQEDSPLYGSRLVAFIHDELILEVPENRVHTAAQELATLMVIEFLTACPDVPVKVESLAMRRWSKDAKAKYENGVLVPWEG